MRFFAQLMVCFVIGASTSAQTRTISETVNLAVASHPDTLAKFTELIAQQETINQVGSAFLPQLSVALGIGLEDSTNASTRSASGADSEQLDRRESSISLSQMLFDGFKTHWQREQELETRSAIEYELAYVAGQVAIKAIDSHLELAKANQLLHFNMESLQVHEQIAADIGARASGGRDDRAKVSQIRARLALAQANLEVAKNNVIKANGNYRMAVGVAPDQELLFQDKLINMPDSITELLADVNQHNPLILARMMDEKAAKSSTKAAKSTDLPVLFLESGASWNANIDGVEERDNDAYLMLRMRYNLYTGGADRAAKNQAALLSKKVSYELDNSRRELMREADETWHSYQSSDRRLTFLDEYVEYARLTKETYQKQANIGQRTLLDLLDAENELQSALRQRIEAQKEGVLSGYQMLNLKGQLLTQLAVDVSKADLPRTESNLAQ